MKPKRKAIIVLTGGVSGGHATPMLSVFFTLKNDHGLLRETKEVSFFYFGRKEGLERDVFERLVDRYVSIPASKLRSHFSWKNFSDLVRLPSVFLLALGEMIGVRRHALKEKADVVLFSSGGYIALPVVFSAWLCRIPTVIHEQTSRAGLANRLTSRVASKVLVSFEASKPFFQSKKTYFTGYPFLKKTRIILANNDQIDKNDETFSLKIPKNKKFLLIMGGSAGSQFINNLLLEQIEELQKKFFIFHQVGRDNLFDFLKMRSENYFPAGFVSGEEWVTLLKKADVIVSRSGAGTVSECIYLKKKVIFVPLKISRNDEQFYNAVEANKYIDSRIIVEDEFRTEEGKTILPKAIDELLVSTKKVSKEKKIAWEIFKHRTDNAALTIACHVKQFFSDKPQRQFPKMKRSANRSAATKYANKQHGKSNAGNRKGRRGKSNTEQYRRNR